MHLGVPQLARLIERTCDDLVSPGVVKRDRIHDVSVPVERQKLVPRRGVPYLPAHEVNNIKKGKGVRFHSASHIHIMGARFGSNSGLCLGCLDAWTGRNMTIITVACMRSTISAGCPLYMCDQVCFRFLHIAC